MPTAEEDCPTTGPSFAIEGYGRDVDGGCVPGRTVYTVTRLDDNPAIPQVGSLRHALAQSGPRLVKFAISGNIELQDMIDVINGDLTINGIDAPNGGICIRPAPGVNWLTPVEKEAVLFFGPACSNVILRHLRIRHGLNENSNADTLQIQCNGMVVDHCSLTWGMDEVLNISGEDDGVNQNNARNVTIQWSIIGEGFDSRLGNLINADATQISIHHCFYVHNEERNPNVSGNGIYEIINTVTYNAGFKLGVTNQKGPSASSPTGISRIDYIKNYEKEGPNSNGGNWISSGDAAQFDSAIYVLGNRNAVRDEDSDPENIIMNLNPACPPGTGCWQVGTRNNTSSDITEHNALDLVNPLHSDYLLDKVGATMPRRDEVDTRLVANFHAGTGAWPDSEDDPLVPGMNGFPDLTIPSGTPEVTIRGAFTIS